MRDFKKLFSEFIEDESGLTAVEYAIAGSLVVGGAVTAFSTLGTSVDVKIGELCTEMKNNNTGSPSCQ